MELRSAVGDGGLLVDHGRQRLIADVDALQCVIGRLARLGDNQRDAFADETNPVDGHHRAVRHDRPGHDPVGLDVADLAGEVGAGESEAHAGGGPGCRKVYASDQSVRMRRPQDRQVKHAGQSYVVDIAPRCQ